MTRSFTGLKGVIHGKVIELDQPTGLPEGLRVRVTVDALPSTQTPAPPASQPEEARRRWEEAWVKVKDLPPGEGLRMAFGAWAADADAVDQFLEWNRNQRQHERRAPEL